MQSILDLFSEAFETTLAQPNETLTEAIQHVKSDLYKRDYMAAFGSQENLDVYVVRWSPSRALAYYELFNQLNILKDKTPNVLSIGGGACGELASLLALTVEGHRKRDIKLNMVDIAAWGECIDKMMEAFPKIYGTGGATVFSTFKEGDILDPQTIPSFAPYTLITSMFTTNELFAASRPDSIKWLHRLNNECEKGTLFLVCESAGSYSDLQVGSKIFPVHFLIDMTLAGGPRGTKGPWEIVSQSDRQWFRKGEEELNYPWKLEDMRYFYRLYRKK